MSTLDVSFGAKPVNSITIKKYDKNKKNFIDIPAKFVMLESGNNSDIKVLDRIATQWTNADYIRRIATASHWMNELPINIYALTTQKDKFDKLKPSKILGFAEMRKNANFPDYDWLHYLQVKPEAMNTQKGENKSFQSVGTAMIKSLKKIYHNITLYAADSPYVENFYKKNGFIEDYMLTRHYLWSSNIFKRLKVRIENFIHKNGF